MLKALGNFAEKIPSTQNSLSGRLERIKRFLRFVPPLLLNLWRYLYIYIVRGPHRDRKIEQEILEQLGHASPLSPKVVILRGQQFCVLDGPTFAGIYREQFHQEIFRFQPRSSSPLIIDCGANVGLVTAYFKSIFPDARIIAFEPDPSCFAALNKLLAFK